MNHHRERSDRLADESDQSPTLPNPQASPPPRARAPEPPRIAESTGGGRASASLARSSAPSLRRQEAMRARGFAACVGALCAFAALAEPFVAGAWWLRAITMATLTMVAASAARLWILARDPSRYTRALARGFAAASLAASIVLTYRIGVLSPAPLLTALGVAFYGLGEDRRLAGAFGGLSALAYVALALLVGSGALPDAGMVRALAAPPEARVVTALFVPLALAAVLTMARLTRRAALDAIRRSSDWLREVRQREAQLDEANRDLDQLLKMSAGEMAPYSGMTAGKYLLGQRIGRGAMGEVYAATREGTKEPAAVKLLHPSMQEDALYMQRFLREGEAASKLRAPNVVSIFEVGKMEDGAPFIAMELLRGHDLGWHLRRRGRIAMDEVLYIVEQVAAGLEAARIAGVVHRDLKPQNLFLAQQMNAAPVWKILDFGVSRMDGSSGTLTKDIIVGTPGYMSPEQAGGLAATHRSDVFSFGAVVYRALTGHPPFTAADMPQTLYQVVYRNPARPSEIVPTIPPDVDLVLAIALAKDPADRFASALELANALAGASRSALAPELRLQGRTLVAALPWGTGARDSFLGDEDLEDDEEPESFERSRE